MNTSKNFAEKVKQILNSFFVNLSLLEAKDTDISKKYYIYKIEYVLSFAAKTLRNSYLVIVNPSRVGPSLAILTPTRPRPASVTTWPRITAARLKKRQSFILNSNISVRDIAPYDIFPPIFYQANESYFLHENKMFKMNCVLLVEKLKAK